MKGHKATIGNAESLYPPLEKAVKEKPQEEHDNCACAISIKLSLRAFSESPPS